MLLSASVRRFGVPRIRDFFILVLLSTHGKVFLQLYIIFHSQGPENGLSGWASPWRVCYQCAGSTPSSFNTRSIFLHEHISIHTVFSTKKMQFAYNNRKLLFLKAPKWPLTGRKLTLKEPKMPLTVSQLPIMLMEI